MYKNLELNTKYLCLDIETTSLFPENEAIVECYWKLMKNNEKIDEAHMLFDHKNAHKTRHIHQISEEELKGKPEFDSDHHDVVQFKDKLKSLLMKCISGEITFMAQYANFEMNWLSKKLKMDLSNISVYDTRAAEKLLNYGVSASLIPMCARRGIESPNGVDFHRADWDVEAMWQVHLQQVQELKEKKIDLSKVKFDMKAR